MAETEEELLLAGGDADANMDHIDEEKLLADEDPNFNPFQVKQEELDLFDAAIEPSGVDKDVPLVTTPAVISTPTPPSSASSSLGITTNAGITFSNSAANIANITGKKYCCYIGNMSWWTTDDDLVKVITSCGVDDLVDLKFYENRLNGQSKGFCLAVFLTDLSVRTITEKLPLKPVHGQTLVVLSYSKISLARLEEASAKSQTRIEQQKKAKEENGMLNMGTIRIGAMGITPMGPGGPLGPPVQQQPPPMMNMAMMGQRPPMGVQMGGPMMGGGAMVGRPGGPGGPMNPQQQMIIPQTRILPGGMVQMGGPPPQMGPGGGMRPGVGPGGPQMNQPPPGMGQRGPMGGAPPPSGPPQPLMGRPVAAPPNVGGAGFPAGAHINPNVYPGYGQQQEAPLDAAEVEEVMNRNRTISSSAISRAISDATSGNHADAIETLLTAISLIKQSRVAHDERCKLLISSLHDTLSGIEAKMKERKRERRDRSRSRSRERKHRRRLSILPPLNGISVGGTTIDNLEITVA
ncbi:cfim-2 [Pristionchus pacificus]|uniref:Cfim-2 n=1 Tax=Pristionchus pacificus TaxID=54126 RepID=A0A2A6BY92_PRIPA|nr:cfim-2 [Pristionchus pacificus]|eukprot:PDM70858.1 cfim-2 [Pristionchus pacificus]